MILMRGFLSMPYMFSTPA
jgi:hypothetical protein